MYTSGLIFIFTLEVLESLSCADVSYTTARKVTLLNCCTCGVEGILYTVFLLFHLNLGLCAYIKDCNTTSELSETFLKFLLVIVRSSRRDLLADKLNALCNVILIACTAYDCSILLADSDFLRLTKHLRSSVLKSESSLLGDKGCTCKSCYILKHLLAAVSKSRSLYSGYLDCATKPVDNKCCKSLTVNILSYDE